MRWNNVLGVVVAAFSFVAVAAHAEHRNDMTFDRGAAAPEASATNPLPNGQSIKMISRPGASETTSQPAPSAPVQNFVGNTISLLKNGSALPEIKAGSPPDPNKKPIGSPYVGLVPRESEQPVVLPSTKIAVPELKPVGGSFTVTGGSGSGGGGSGGGSGNGQPNSAGPAAPQGAGAGGGAPPPPPPPQQPPPPPKVPPMPPPVAPPVGNPPPKEPPPKGTKPTTGDQAPPKSDPRADLIKALGLEPPKTGTLGDGQKALRDVVSAMPDARVAELLAAQRTYTNLKDADNRESSESLQKAAELMVKLLTPVPPTQGATPDPKAPSAETLTKATQYLQKQVGLEGPKAEETKK